MLEGETKQESPASAAETVCQIYSKGELSRELRQGEIISNIAQYIYDSAKQEVEATFHKYAIIATQDCDLLWDYEARSEGLPSELNGVLLYEAEPASDVKTTLPPGNDIWKRITQNRDERYHFLQSIEAAYDFIGNGIPNLIVDFKRFFTLPAGEVHHQLVSTDGAKRRCRLDMPYREHFQTRAAFYFQRVMLPVPHKYEKLSSTSALPKG